MNNLFGAKFGKKIRAACLFLWRLFVTLAVMFGGIAAVVFAIVLLHRPDSGVLGFFVLMLPLMVFFVFLTEFLLRYARKSSEQDINSSSAADALDVRLRAARKKIYFALGAGLVIGALTQVPRLF
jgi:membrane protein YdbS with pleckstrin-like domain